MNWIIYALVSLFGIGAFNAFMQGTKKDIPKGIHNKHMYLCIMMICAGIMNGIILLYYYFTKKKDFNILIKKSIKFPYTIIIVPAAIMSLYLLTSILALNGGGGIAMGVINLNMFVTLIAGVILFGDKINLKIIFAAITAAIAIAYAAYETMKLK